MMLRTLTFITLTCLCLAATADDTDLADIEEVRIGYFGPSDPDHPGGGDAWRAAQLAVEGQNARGGYRGKPFRLVAVWSNDPWGSGVKQVVRMAYKDRVWAIVGGIDGPSTHLAEQVVAKARLTLISPASTDRTVNSANVPWMFSCVPADHLQTPLLAAEIAARVAAKPFVLISTNDHDSHLFAVELKKRLTSRRLIPRYHFECKPNAEDVAEVASRAVKSKAAAAVIVAGPRDSARLVRAVREQGFSGHIFGGPAMGRRGFLQQAGDAAEGAVFPLLYHPGETAVEFERAFLRRFEISPDYAAAGAFDAVRIVVAAIRTAGLDRAAIRNAVDDLSPWTGVTGTVSWDAQGGNTRPACLGTIKDGSPIIVP